MLNKQQQSDALERHAAIIDADSAKFTLAILNARDSARV
jgi:hypothetical protein